MKKDLGLLDLMIKSVNLTNNSILKLFYVYYTNNINYRYGDYKIDSKKKSQVINILIKNGFNIINDYIGDTEYNNTYFDSFYFNDIFDGNAMINFRHCEDYLRDFDLPTDLKKNKKKNKNLLPLKLIFSNSDNTAFIYYSFTYVDDVDEIYYIYDINNKIINTLIKSIHDDFKLPEVPEDVFINFISSNGALNLNKQKININEVKDYYYSDNLNIEEIIAVLNREKPGILIFSGISGSGKTTLIKYLASVIDKNFCYLSPDNINIFNSPTATNFVFNELKNSVIILEDCENLIKDRKTYMSDVNTLLNLGDGILGEALNIKIILTYNIANNIDTAVLRKGRCLYKHEFGLLKPDIANRISKEIGCDVEYTNEVSISEIFNDKDKDYSLKKKEKIGFV
jgi:energy-coupling factor transporter ATP-binding protein EcfA2